MAILAALFAEDRADEIAIASVTRFARLLSDAGRHEELARLWEDQARSRADAGDRAAAAALFARAADIWEAKVQNCARAIAVHREGAALGGEVSLQALARLHREQKNFRASAVALEWLYAQSTREDLGERALLLADTYLTLGEWEQARARLEHAAGVAIDAEPVRRKLGELYRRYGEWEPLCLLLVADADRSLGDRARLSLLREAADLHIRERRDPSAAIPLFERAIEIEPEDPTLRLALGGALRASGRYEEAGAVLRTQIERYGARRPKDRAIVHLHLARVSLAAGRRAEALSELELGTKINPAHPGILHELGRLSLAEGQLARAERTYRALLLVQRRPEEDAEEVPGRAEIYLDLSGIAAALGEPERAAELVESAFEAALDNPADAASLERSLLESKRYDLLARAVEGRLAAAPEPMSAARALSDLVLLHATHLLGEADITPRVQGDALRIHRDLESRKIADDGAWAAMSRVYEWLGDATLEAKALERRVEALLAAPSVEDVEPLLRLAEIRLLDSSRRGEGVTLVERALDAGVGSERPFKLLEAASAAAPGDEAVLRLLERIAREPGRERTLVDVMVLRAEAGVVPIEAVREAVDLARRFADGPAEQALLRGALAHVESYDPRDRGWVEERLARLLLEAGELSGATSLFEEASRHAESGHRRELARQAARLSADSLLDLGRAARLYRELLESDPADREVWEPLLDVYRRAGDRERLMVLIGSTAPLVDSLRDRGRLRLEEATLMLAEPERAPAAIELLEGILREDPAQDDAAELLATLLAREGKRAELVRLASSRLDMAKSTGDPQRVESRALALGALLEEEGDPGSAREIYGSVLDWNPASRGALGAIVRLEDARGADPADVADAIERLLAVEEGEAVSSLAARLVELRTEQGDSLGVERALEIACAANPLDVSLREQLVARCLERVDWQHAATVLRRASMADPADHGLLMRAVEAFEHAGDLARAVETLDLALGESPADPDLHVERARLLSELGQHDRALKDIEDAHAQGAGRASDLSAALVAAIERSEGEERAAHTLRLVNLLEELGETTAAREQTKPYGPVPRDDRFYQWYDWNSLLAEEPENRAIMPRLMDGTSSFPSRPEMEANLAAFVERAGLQVRYDCRWEATRRDGERFVLHTTDGEYRCQVAIFAVGVAEPYKPDTPGFEHVAHYADTRPPETYAGKRLFIVGKENSGFELATGLLQWAQRIVLASPRPAKLSVNTHSLLGIRARYVQPFEDQNLGGGVFILNASIDRVERTAGGGFRVFCVRSEDGTELNVEADEVIAATGFPVRCATCRTLAWPSSGRSNLPAMTNYWESATVPGIYFAGTIGQGVAGMKKYGLPANSGAVHGARYNARTMVYHVATTHFGVELPRPEVKPDALVDLLLTEATRAPELWNQKSYLARAFSLDAGSGHPRRGHRAAGRSSSTRRARPPWRSRSRPTTRATSIRRFTCASRPAGGRDAARVEPAARLPLGREPGAAVEPAQRSERRRRQVSGDGSAASGRRLAEINSMIIECMRCPRLVAWREEAARRPPARFAGEHYWARPLPGFGDPSLRGCSSSGSRRRPTAATGPGACSPATGRATSCSRRCTERGMPTRPRPSRATMA